MSKFRFLIGASMVLGSTAAAFATAAPAPRKPVPAATSASQSQEPSRAQLIKNLDAQFKALDKNGDGMLEKDELAAAQAKSIEQQLTNVRARMDTEFTKLDTNHDGQLSRAEFLVAAPVAPTTAPDVSRGFAEFDKSKDGKVTLAEYQTQMLARFDAMDKQHKGSITEQDGATVTRADFANRLPAMFKAIDTANRGYFTQADLVAADVRIRDQRVAAARQRFDAEFTKLDMDKNGQLSRTEFMAASPTMPAKLPDGSGILTQLDKNHDGKVSPDEYRAPLLARFDAIDTNHDGVIEPSERQAAAARAPKAANRK